MPQEKRDFINAAYAEEVGYWKRAALGSKNEEERKQITDLAPSNFFWGAGGCKDAGKSRAENIYEMLFYLRKNYLTHTEEQARIDDILQDDRFSFEEMFDYLKKNFKICRRSQKYDFEEQSIAWRVAFNSSKSV